MVSFFLFIGMRYQAPAMDTSPADVFIRSVKRTILIEITVTQGSSHIIQSSIVISPLQTAHNRVSSGAQFCKFLNI
jgi:hypothetical protein